MEPGVLNVAASGLRLLRGLVPPLLPRLGPLPPSAAHHAACPDCAADDQNADEDEGEGAHGPEVERLDHNDPLVLEEPHDSAGEHQDAERHPGHQTASYRTPRHGRTASRRGRAYLTLSFPATACGLIWPGPSRAGAPPRQAPR